MRLFAAIELPETARAHLEQVLRVMRQACVSSPVSFVRPANLHVTLKFFGEVNDSVLHALEDVLNTVQLADVLSFRVDRPVFFPTVLAMRICATTGQSEALHAAIENACEPLGFKREDRRYTPHVTLVRFRKRLDQESRLALTANVDELSVSPSFDVQEFVLMRSVLRPTGAEYAVVSRHRLH